MKKIIKMTLTAVFCSLFTITLSAQEVTVVEYGKKSDIKLVGIGSKSADSVRIRVVNSATGEESVMAVKTATFDDSMVNIIPAEEAVNMMRADGEKAKLIYVGKSENNRSKTAFVIERKAGMKSSILREAYPDKDTKLYIVGDSEFMAKMLANELQVFNHFDKSHVYVVKGEQDDWFRANPNDKK